MVLGMLAAGNGCQGDAGGCLMKRCLGLDAGLWLGRFGDSRQLLLQWSLEPCYMNSPSVC